VIGSAGTRHDVGVAFTGFPVAAFEFYDGLAADNSKTYWTANKAVYEDAVRTPFLALAAELEPEFGPGKIFRPHRDVRFSADKSPYKTNQGLFCQTADGAGYYVQIDPHGLMTAGGFYSHTKDQVGRYRAAVDRDDIGRELEAILHVLTKAGFSTGGDTVRTRPRGCPADHPRLDLMRHESLTASRVHPPAARLGTRRALDLIRNDWRALRPFNEWVAAHVGGG
jgi:uncharacterized protein (TIGR02453 family)